MFHDYYYYNREQLLAAPKIPLIVMEDNETVFAQWRTRWQMKFKGRMPSGRKQY